MLSSELYGKSTRIIIIQLIIHLAQGAVSESH